MKIRHGNIDAHLTSGDNVDAFASMMVHMVNLYKTCPDASKIRFIQAIEDQFKANAPARGRTSGGNSGGSSWRDHQKAQFSGRGAKWIKLTGTLMDMVLVQLGIFDNAGEDTEDYRSWINEAGYAWVRYSGPRGTEEAQELAFEVRVGGSKIDHPKHLFRVTSQMWDQLEGDREVLGGTPFGMSLEG